MIEISNAVSSSISSTRAGIVSSPAAFDARHRRSPAMSWNSPSSSGGGGGGFSGGGGGGGGGGAGGGF